MVNYLSEIWRCRFFWLHLVKMDLRTRYRRSILGLGWPSGITCLAPPSQAAIVSSRANPTSVSTPRRSPFIRCGRRSAARCTFSSP